MAAEYSAIALQTVAVDDNVLFNNGFRACRKGFISHRDVPFLTNYRKRLWISF